MKIGNMKKKCKIILLSSENEEGSVITDYKGLVYNPQSVHLNDGIPQHLYIISDDEIKEGDWIYNPDTKHVLKVNNLNGHGDYYCTFENKNVFCFPDKGQFFKIIATTDSSLKLCKQPESCNSSLTKKCICPDKLPQPSESFIKEYIEKYNKGETIKDVMVEYEKYNGTTLISNDWNGKLKLNFNNTIIIDQVKDSYTENEVIDLCIKHYLEIGSNKGCNLGENVREWTEKWFLTKR